MDVGVLARYIGLLMAASLVTCLMISWVTGQTRTWSVFVIASFIGIFTYAVVSGRLTGDHPGVALAPFFALTALGMLGLIFGVIWTQASGVLRSILRKRKKPDAAENANPPGRGT